MLKRKRSPQGRVRHESTSPGLMTPDSRSEHKQPTPLNPRSPGVASRATTPSSASTSSAESDAKDSRLPRPRRRVLSHVLAGDVEFPISEYQRLGPPPPISTEAEAIKALSAAYDHVASEAERPEYVSFLLDRFSVYRTHFGSHATSLVSLDQLQNGRGCDEFLFDGLLTCEETRCLVQGVRFSVVAIDGYGDPDVLSMEGHICIQSPMARANNIWYQLGTPSPEYRRFYRPFLWLASFAKHFIDFLLYHRDGVTLEAFKQRFFGWLHVRLSSEKGFWAWLRQCNLRDFRTTVAAHVGFLWKECHSIDDQESRLLEHPIWIEIDPVKLAAIPRRPTREGCTVVTPFVYECFRAMYFGTHLARRDISNSLIREAVLQRKKALGLTVLGQMERKRSQMPTPESVSGSLDVTRGDVVCVAPDTKSAWSSTATTWYAYVQGVRHVEGETLLDVLWLYDPSDTTLGSSYYPYSNELFLSDNCNCGKDAIDLSQVTAKADVSFFVRDPISVTGLFVRQKFRTVHDEDKYDFVSLKPSDFSCGCETDQVAVFDHCRQRYQIGETILFLDHSPITGKPRFEPAQIIDFLLIRRQVVLRRLIRKNEASLDPCPLNELLQTDETFAVSPSSIFRRCHVRYFDPDVVKEGLPVPYSQHGVGDHFFIVRDTTPIGSPSTLASSLDSLEVDDVKFPPLDQGWEPDARPPMSKLIGMGLFCGGGNFDRGIEDSGAVDFRYAIDYNEHALHSYRANAKDTDQLQLFLGSVDDYLAQAMAGSTESVIAPIGDCEVIVGGSPCQGFSLANHRNEDLKGQRNASMVASALAYIDFYSPKYCILENVIAMTNGKGPRREENVFRQILATLVAMGYQVQQFLMEAWLFGSPQSRSRVFIVASAPGIEPLPFPNYSHGDTERWPGKKLGASSNGKPFGVRRQQETAFDHVSPQAATADLPNIGDALPQVCPSFPDHRTSVQDTNLGRCCAATTPMYPRGMGLVQAITQGTEQRRLIEEGNEEALLKRGTALVSAVTGAPLDFFHEKLSKNVIRSGTRSKVYARVHSDRLFPTMMTVMCPTDGINGTVLHWNQPRCLTVMEARRAQGFLDHEVIVGSPAQQMKIVGNSVDRKVAIALGLALRESWLQTGVPGH